MGHRHIFFNTRLVKAVFSKLLDFLHLLGPVLSDNPHVTRNPEDPKFPNLRMVMLLASQSGSQCLCQKTWWRNCFMRLLGTFWRIISRFLEEDRRGHKMNPQTRAAWPFNTMCPSRRKFEGRCIKLLEKVGLVASTMKTSYSWFDQNIFLYRSYRTYVPCIWQVPENDDTYIYIIYIIHIH